MDTRKTVGDIPASANFTSQLFVQTSPIFAYLYLFVMSVFRLLVAASPRASLCRHQRDLISLELGGRSTTHQHKRTNLQTVLPLSPATLVIENASPSSYGRSGPVWSARELWAVWISAESVF